MSERLWLTKKQEEELEYLEWAHHVGIELVGASLIVQYYALRFTLLQTFSLSTSIEKKGFGIFFMAYKSFVMKIINNYWCAGFRNILTS